MKKRNIFSVFIFVFIILGLFNSCGDSDGTNTSSGDPGSNSTKYTVKFEANGGLPAPEQQSISQGGKVVMPPAMTKSGYNFGGWYKEANCTNQWDFTADTVSGNITLFAKWDFITTTPIPIPSTTLADKLAWLRNNAERDSTYLLEITAAYEELAPQNLFYPGRNNITIRLKGIGIGRVIGCSSLSSGSSNPPIFTVRDGVTLILDENLILCKDDSYEYYYSAVQVNSGGTLLMNQGAKITKFNNGAVNVRGGTFTMNGGEISGNTSFSYSSGCSGGGVYVNSGTFTKSGGIITGYTSDAVNGNVVKINDVVQNDKGHAVYVSSSRYRNTTAGETDQIDTTTGKGLSADGNSPFGQ